MTNKGMKFLFLLILLTVTGTCDVWFTATCVFAMYNDWGELQTGISKASDENSGTPGGWRCSVCTEVVTTYRDSVTCNHASPSGGVICGLSSSCDQFDTPGRKASCQDLKKSFRESKSNAKQIIDGIDSETEPFELCVELGKCQSQTTTEGSTCFKALNTARCEHDPTCPTGANNCDDTCLTCVWLTRTWPVFSGKCEAAILGASAKTSGSAKGLSTMANTKLRRRLLEAAAGEPATVGLGSPPNDPDPLTPRSQDELAGYCYETWDTLEKSPRARYVSSFTDQLGQYPWTADLACKCLRACAYDEFEALRIVSACDFVDQTEDLSNAVYPDLAKQRVKTPDRTSFEYFEGSSLLRP